MIEISGGTLDFLHLEEYEMSKAGRAEGSVTLNIWSEVDQWPGRPSSRDRQDIATTATTGAGRVEVWDFFFPVDPARLLGPRREEIARLEGEVKRKKQHLDTRRELLTGDLRASTQALADVKEEADRRLQAIDEASVRTEVQKKLASERLAVYALGGVSPVLILWGFSLFGSGCGSSLLALLLVPAGLFSAISGVRRYLQVRRTESGEVERRLVAARREIVDERTRRENETGRRISGLQEDLKECNRDLGRLAQLPVRISQLRAEVEGLTAQIPRRVSGDEIRQVFDADMRRLREEAIDDVSFRDKLIEILDAPNPIELWAPAILQSPDDRLPPSYTRPDSDHQRHRSAIRVEVVGSGSVADFHGVYFIWYFLFGREKIATVGLFYDFIRGRSFGKSWSEQHYKDMVTIQKRTVYRSFGEGADIAEHEAVPTLTFTMTDSRATEISFSDRAFLEKMSSLSLEGRSWLYDPATGIDNAIRALKSYKDDAKTAK